MDVAAFSMTLSPLYRQYQIFSHHHFPLHVRLYSLYFTNWHTFSFTLVMFDISAIALWLSEVSHFEIHWHQSNISYFQLCIDTYCRTVAKVRVWEGVCVWVWWRQTWVFVWWLQDINNGNRKHLWCCSHCDQSFLVVIAPFKTFFSQALPRPTLKFQRVIKLVGWCHRVHISI